MAFLIIQLFTNYEGIKSRGQQFENRPTYDFFHFDKKSLKKVRPILKQSGQFFFYMVVMTILNILMKQTAWKEEIKPPKFNSGWWVVSAPCLYKMCLPL